MFSVSGSAGLIYEIVWIRVLSYVFGTGNYALSAVRVAPLADAPEGGWWRELRKWRFRRLLSGFDRRGRRTTHPGGAPAGASGC